MRLYSDNGDPITAEDVLDGDELGEYRLRHPHPPVHQLLTYPPANECDACHEPTNPDVGAFCGGDHCPVADREWDRMLDQHDDIGTED